MKRSMIGAVALLLITGAVYSQALVYPKAKKSNQVDDYFG